MPVKGTDLVIKNIRNFGGGFANHLNKTMEKARKMLDDEVAKNISLTCHSLEDLRKAGHPYAKSHLGWAKNVGGLGHGHWWQVHTQSGEMLRSKSSGTIPARFGGGQFRATAYVAMSEDLEYNAAVIYGTSKMIPRDFLHGSLGSIKGDIYKLIADNLSAGFKEKAAFGLETKNY